MKIFYRTTSNTAGKYRPDWFSYDACYKNLLSVVGKDDELIVFFDGDPGERDYSDADVLVTIEGGSETKSFTKLLDYIKDKNYNDDELIYIVEDDYLHRKGGLEAMKECFEKTNVDYVTLYDHADKYFPNYYDRFAVGFKIMLFHTDTCHWRTTPSTTNTFATRYKTLVEDIDVHKEYSPETLKTSRDHEKFFALWQKGRSLVSPIPGFSTHVENMLMSPCIDWASLSNENSLSVDSLDDPVTETSA